MHRGELFGQRFEGELGEHHPPHHPLLAAAPTDDSLVSAALEALFNELIEPSPAASEGGCPEEVGIPSECDRSFADIRGDFSASYSDAGAEGVIHRSRALLLCAHFLIRPMMELCVVARPLPSPRVDVRCLAMLL